MANNSHMFPNFEAGLNTDCCLLRSISFYCMTNADPHNFKGATCQAYINHGAHIGQKYLEYLGSGNRQHVKRLKPSDTFTALIANCAWYVDLVALISTVLTIIGISTKLAIMIPASNWLRLPVMLARTKPVLDTLISRTRLDVAISIWIGWKSADKITKLYWISKSRNTPTMTWRWQLSTTWVITYTPAPLYYTSHTWTSFWGFTGTTCLSPFKIGKADMTNTEYGQSGNISRKIWRCLRVF